jgi:hypothetical protein
MPINNPHLVAPPRSHREVNLRGRAGRTASRSIPSAEAQYAIIAGLLGMATTILIVLTAFGHSL